MHALLQSSKQMHLKQVHLELCRNKLQKQSIWGETEPHNVGDSQCWAVLDPHVPLQCLLLRAIKA